MKRRSKLFYVTVLLCCISIAVEVQGKEVEKKGIRIGWSIEDITPNGDVQLAGQYYERKAEYVQSRLMVTALAIESIDASGLNEQAIMVTFDLIAIPRIFQDSLKSLVKDQLPDFNIENLFVSATHTHSGPRTTVEGQLGKFLLEKGVNAIVSAWNNREPGGVSWGIGYATVGHNRRVAFADGTTEMYGDPSREDFIGIEGPTDPSVDMLFCWDMNNNLTGVIMNVSCPAQVTESKHYVSADFWDEVRKQLADRFPNGVYVLPQLGASGDISPRDLSTNYKAGEPNMWDVAGSVEIGKRLALVFDEAYIRAKTSIKDKIIFKHDVTEVDLPRRRITDTEYLKAQALTEEIYMKEPTDKDDPGTAWNRFLAEIQANEQIKEYGPWDNKESDFGRLRPAEMILDKYKNPGNPFYRITMNTIRLGDVAFANNPFELYVNYGLQITAKSKAKQVFVIQLSGDSGGYLPTEEAAKRGGYSAQVTEVGPAGGAVLVKETVAAINALWP